MRLTVGRRTGSESQQRQRLMLAGVFHLETLAAVSTAESVVIAFLPLHLIARSRR